MTLLSAPIELAGDWGASTPEDALVVLSRTREVCLTGIRLLSDDQPAALRVESRSSGPPHVWLQSSTRAHVVVDGTARDWGRMAYQFGHELGHVLSNSWQPDSLPLRPSIWLEEALVEAFTLRGLALIADSWEQDPWLPGEAGYSKDLRRYREFLIGGYRNGAAGSKQWLNGWFADSRHRRRELPWGKSRCRTGFADDPRRIGARQGLCRRFGRAQPLARSSSGPC